MKEEEILGRLYFEISGHKYVQRMKQIHQLGVSSILYRPCLKYSRFHHSVGVSYLAGSVGNTIKAKHPELGITDKDILTLRVSGLLHDVGHGPFSHSLDDFLSEVLPQSTPHIHHERRSCDITEYILRDAILQVPQLSTTEFDIDVFIQQVKHLISGKISPNFPTALAYLINQQNPDAIDCDRLEYLVRDSRMIQHPTHSTWQSLQNDMIRGCFIEDGVARFPEHIESKFVCLRNYLYTFVYPLLHCKKSTYGMYSRYFENLDGLICNVDTSTPQGVEQFCSLTESDCFGYF